MVTPSCRAGALRLVLLVSILAASFLAAPAAAPAAVAVEGPIPGTVPGDPASPILSETYPFFSTWLDLAASGYVEEEFYVSGLADAYSTAGSKLASDVPYRTRMIVRRPASQTDFNGTVLVEWQNVTAGYDLDALWNWRHLREGYAWVGVSAQRVGRRPLAQLEPGALRKPRRHGRRRVRHRPALVRHLRPGRAGVALAVRASIRWAASRSSAWSRSAPRSRRAA